MSGALWGVFRFFVTVIVVDIDEFSSFVTVAVVVADAEVVVLVLSSSSSRLSLLVTPIANALGLLASNVQYWGPRLRVLQQVLGGLCRFVVVVAFL